MSESWHPALKESEFPDDGKISCILNGWYVLIGRLDDGYAAVIDRCTHQSARLSGGKVRRGTVMCPLHGARFDIKNGKCLGGAYQDLKTFSLRVTDGVIEVLVPDAAPAAGDVPVSA